MLTKYQKRLNEIVFCNLIKKLLRSHSNPIKVYEFISAVAFVTDANMTILNSVLTIILNNDRRYLPTKHEYVFILKHSLVPVRRICQLVHISPNAYYSERFDDVVTEPKFSEAQYTEMMKILKFFKDTYEDLEGAEL